MNICLSTSVFSGYFSDPLLPAPCAHHSSYNIPNFSPLTCIHIAVISFSRSLFLYSSSDSCVLLLRSFMEPQHHLQQQQQPNEDVGSSSGNKSSFLCRQSSTRWTPTADQIRILKDLYYNNGVRSPSAEQIQRISARLRQYGKIEGKNVFYWFQNHKARERQKKRFSVETSMQRGAGNCGWKPEDSVHLHKYTNINPGISRPSSPSSHGVLAAGHGYGTLLMENSFRDCSISAGGNGCEGYDLGWFGMDPYSSSYTPLDKRKLNNAFEEETPEIETLPLFPVHGEDIAGFCVGKPDSCWYRRDDERGSSRTSLELTLNSYAGKSPSST